MKGAGGTMGHDFLSWVTYMLFASMHTYMHLCIYASCIRISVLFFVCCLRLIKIPMDSVADATEMFL